MAVAAAIDINENGKDTKLQDKSRDAPLYKPSCAS